MTKPISKRSFRKPDARYAPIDLVVCEGESERGLSLQNLLEIGEFTFIFVRVMGLILKAL